MKRLLLVVVTCFAAAMKARAEIHTVGVDISRRADNTVRVSIISGVPDEAKKDVSVPEAAKILRNVKGSGSTVFVGIITRDVIALEYLPILQAIAANGADIAFIDGDAVDYMKENIRKGIISAR